MLVVEQRLSARRVGRGVVLRARFVHGVEAQGWRMKFSLLRTEVEIDAEPETYMELARRLRAANVIVKPGRSRLAITPKAVTSPILVNKPILTQPSTFNTNNQMKPIYCQDTEVKVSNPSCHSPGAILPDLPQPAEEPDKNQGLSKEASSSETQSWLSQHRFNQHIMTFANFSGADLLRLSRDDIIQICGLADGIRLYNSLHAKRIEPRLTLYVCPAGGSVYSAIYLHACKASELLHKLKAIGRHEDCEMVLVSGPNGTRVRLTDELVRHLPDNSTYTLAREHDALLLAAW
ncbi:unnamed protein product [Danaus chrysippus]|uniref:(African queen) hypothetical protein n=1 Tax=Danaus chrysippus TaxID=151541 RepID=A0A8J2QYW8_9NEOP|nr:unnamed protein product [Danaus chrysippus]